MGQKINPISLRLGYIRGWESMWFGDKDYAEKLNEDFKIRKFIHKKIRKGGISRIVIERTLKRVTVTIHTARPGIVIGKGGQEVDRLREDLKNLTQKDVQINIFEIKRPDLEARLVGENIANQLEARVSFRRALKGAIQNTMRAGAEGIKVRASGRLGGAEMARSEGYKEGRTPLHTFRADIDYALAEALTIYGKIGIKVWICKGEVFGKRDLSMNVGFKSDNEGRGGFNNDRGGDRRGGDRRGGDRRGGNDRGGDRRGGNSGGQGGYNRDNRGGGQGGFNRGGNPGSSNANAGGNRGGGAPQNNRPR